MNETWTAAEYTDPQFLASMIEHTEEITGLVVLQLADGNIRVSKRQAFINLFYWQILVAFNIPICKRHFLKRMPLNKDSQTTFLDNYYDEIMDRYPKAAKQLKHAIWDVENQMYKWCFDYLLPYVSSIDIEDMAVIMNDKPMKKEIDSKYRIDDNWSTTTIEDFIEGHRKVIMKMLGTPGALQRETLLPYQTIGMLNKFQVPQTMYAFGVRTDVNDNIVRKPIIGSAIDGLRDIHEFAVESLSAKKSMFYNKNSVADSQYFGRRQHMLASTVQHLYNGDCGATQLVSFYIKPDDPDHGISSNAENVLGKVIADNGQLVTLNKHNVGKYMGQTIHMRSPMTCRYKNGVCEVCGGRVLSNVSRKMNPGILSAVRMIERITQMILSSKHLIRTKSIVYLIPEQAKAVLEQISANEIRWNRKIVPQLKDCKLGIPSEMFKRFHDVPLLRKDTYINEYKSSKIDTFFIDYAGKIHSYNLFQEKRTPYLSAEFLLKIRDRYEDIVIKDDIIWIPMEGTEKIPIFRTIIVNDSTVEFVESVKSFLTKDIANETSCSSALEKLHEIIQSKVSVNIIHLEMMLKAHLITNEEDFRIPEVIDENNVTFGGLNTVLCNRHVGVRLGYEALNGYIKHPLSYTRDRQKSPFDLMVGYTDC